MTARGPIRARRSPAPRVDGLRVAAGRVGALVAVAALLTGACGGDDSGGGGGDAAGAAGDEPAAVSSAFCEKAAAFDETTSSVRGIATADQMQEAVDELAGVADEAPEQLTDEFDLLTGTLERLVTAMRTTEDGDHAATIAAMQKVLTPETAGEVDEASRTVEAYLDVTCGMGDDEDAAADGDDRTDTTAAPPTSSAPGDPAALGADPELGALATACHGGDMVKCDELYFASPTGSPYETYGDTCGGRTTVDAFCVDTYPPPAG